MPDETPISLSGDYDAPIVSFSLTVDAPNAAHSEGDGYIGAGGSSWRGRLGTLLKERETTLLALITVLGFLTLWELAPHLHLGNPNFTSSPSRIVAAAQWLFAHGFLYDIRVSAAEFALGMGLAVVVGIPVGILLGWYRRPRAMFEPFIIALYSLPRVALMPLLILWLGIGIYSKVAVVFLGAVFPITVSVMAGMTTIDAVLLQCARAFAATDRQIFSTLALPSTVPFLITGLRLGVGRGLVGIVVGELIASRAGIGHMMARAGATFQIDKVFVGVMVLVLVGVTLNEVLRAIERRFESWRPTHT